MDESLVEKYRIRHYDDAATHTYKGFHVTECGEDIIFYNEQRFRGEWVYGSLVIFQGCHYILPTGCSPMCCENYKPIIADTAGSYTGKQDKNGTPLFEGDLVCVSLPWQATDTGRHLCKIYFSYEHLQYRGKFAEEDINDTAFTFAHTSDIEYYTSSLSL